MTAEPLLTIDEITSVLRQRAGSASHVVGVDGFMGSGKTTLAFELAELLAGIRVSLDAYADRNAQTEDYAAKIMQRYLVSDLRKLKAAFQFVVVEGICLLEVLSAVSEPPGSLVYVKRISATGLWHDGFHLEDYESNQSIAENQKGLHKSEFEYHSKWRPHEQAQVVYERPDEESS